MTSIKAVVLDLGGVLEVIDDTVFPEPFERRRGLESGAVVAALAQLEGDAMVGQETMATISEAWRAGLSLDDDATAELVRDYWRWYVGSVDRELFDWFAGLRDRGVATGILSNSGPGAREAERHYGFEHVADDIVYSHEVGLAKPDPRVYSLVERRLGVAAGEVMLVDDVEENVAAARARGWRAVLHRRTEDTIVEVERLLGSAGPG